MLLWDALPSCMLSHFLPAGNPNSGGFHWSPAPHNCSALRPSLTAQEMWWLSAGLCHFWGQTFNRRVLEPHCAGRWRCPETAAPLGSSALSCRCGRYADVGPAPLAQSLWKASLLKKMRWSNRLTAPLENYCVKERKSSQDLNFFQTN